MLPPLVVEGEIPEPPWQYGRSSRYEVLSSCDDRVTRDLVATITRATDAVEAFVPARFLPPPSPHDALILLDETHWPKRSQETVVALLRQPRPVTDVGGDPTNGTASSPHGRTADGPLRVDSLDRGGPLVWNRPGFQPPPAFFGNLRLRDPDGMTTFVLVSRDDRDLADWRLSTQSLRESLERRTPQLPPWFVSGLLAAYANMRLVDDRWTLAPFDGSSLVRPETGGTNLIPLADFFAPPEPRGEDAARRLAQAELLVRWGLDPDDPARREGFGQFVDRVCTQAPEEAIFREYFGFGYDESTTRLATYLDDARRKTVRWRVVDAGATDAAPLVMREADPVEVARIKGAWERMETAYVRGRFPELVPQYHRAARRTLERGLEQTSGEDSGRRADAAVRAELGLLADAFGNRSEARELLEKAVAVGDVVRPVTWTTLARLRYFEVLAAVWPARGPLPVEEWGSAIECLHAAEEQSPPIAETYRIMADVWLATDEPPPPGERDRLYRGAELFAQDGDLSANASLLLARGGDHARARALVELSLSQIEAPAMRERLTASLVGLKADTPVPDPRR